MDQLKLFIVAALVLGLSPLVLLGAGASTQPVVNRAELAADPTAGMMMPPGSDADSADAGRSHRGDRARAALRTSEPPSEKELSDAMQFMSVHSPRRYKFIQDLPDGERKVGLQNSAARAYQRWMLATSNFPLYATVVKRVAVEDEIFGLAGDLRAASADQQPVLAGRLREKLEMLVDISLKERQLRLDNLSKTLKQEQQKLDADSSDRRALVEKRFKSILK